MATVSVKVSGSYLSASGNTRVKRNGVYSAAGPLTIKANGIYEEGGSPVGPNLGLMLEDGSGFLLTESGNILTQESGGT